MYLSAIFFGKIFKVLIINYLNFFSYIFTMYLSAMIMYLSAMIMYLSAMIMYLSAIRLQKLALNNLIINNLQRGQKRLRCIKSI